MPAGATPRFHVDASWPPPLPHNWALGQVSGITVDAADNVWIVQRPATVTDPRRAKPPPVIEFDPAGRVLRAWGGPGRGYDWPASEHGITIDAKGFVWLGGNGTNDGQVLKFTQAGTFVLQIGHPARGAASNDTTRLGRPAGIAVDTLAREVYIADGYANRRVIVFDSDNGAFHRMWGAYGGRPADGARRQFGTPVHCIRLARDGLVYVCDRQNDRVQVFRKTGAYVTEWRVAPQTAGMGSVWDLAFSPAPGEGLAFVADGENECIRLLRRADGAPAAEFGGAGKQPGQFRWVHGLAIDSHGDVFTAEVDHAKRIQRFVPDSAPPWR